MTRSWRERHGASALLGAVLGLLGCADTAPPVDLPACSLTVFTAQVGVSFTREIDLLLVVDDSASMNGQQRSLRDDVARALRALPWSMDPPTSVHTSVHVAVVSSDMGVGGPGSLSEGCARALGGDGRMLREHTGGDPTCTAPALAEPYVSFETGEDLEAVIDQIACLANTGATGCGFEQPLEAALKALTPGSSSLRFVQERGGVVESDTGGHGDGANAGFLREDSLLVIAIVSDEDDCSSGDLDLYSPSGAAPQYPSPLAGPSADPNAQCASHRSALNPVQRYIDGFAALRPGREDQLTFLTVSGVAPALLDAHSAESSVNGHTLRETNYATLLADPGLTEQLDGGGTAVLPACARPDPADPLDEAAAFPVYPGRRLLQVAEALSARGAFSLAGSLCSPLDASAADYALDLEPLTAALDAFIAPREGPPGTVLPRPYPRDANGRVACEWTETLPVGARCADVAGRTLLRSDTEREVCLVDQVVVPPADRLPGAVITGVGWYYDDFDTAEISVWGEQWARYVPGSEPIPGTRLRVECLTYAPRADVDAGPAGATCGVSP